MEAASFMNSLETFYPHFTLLTVQSVEEYRYRSWFELFWPRFDWKLVPHPVQ